jgi:hypothetical protein
MKRAVGVALAVAFACSCNDRVEGATRQKSEASVDPARPWAVGPITVPKGVRRTRFVNPTDEIRRARECSGGFL